MVAQRPQTTKAEISRVDDPSKKVVCQFNPSDFSITKSVKWEYQNRRGKNTPVQEFAGGEAQDFTVNLLFDSTDTATDVRDKYKTLIEMAEIDTTKTDPKTYQSEPPQVQFHWGSFLAFTAVIQSISQEFILFKSDGTPLRARVKVTFSETAKKKKGQNPTTRTESRKVWVVHEGETLDWIAFREYGDSACWRHIAETNGLDNPMELRPGQILKLVPLS